MFCKYFLTVRVLHFHFLNSDSLRAENSLSFHFNEYNLSIFFFHGLSFLSMKFLPNSKSQMGFPGSSAIKNLCANAGDKGCIPGLRRTSGEVNGNLLQDPCLGNPWTVAQRSLVGYSPWGH